MKLIATLTQFTLNLFGYKYEVSIGTPQNQINGNDGHYSPIDQTIRVLEGLSPERVRAVLIHEIVHNVLQSTGLEKLLKDKEIDDEEFTLRISDGLFQVFEANPGQIKKNVIGPYDEFLEDNK